MLKHLESTGITSMSGSREAQDVGAHLRTDLWMKHCMDTDHPCMFLTILLTGNKEYDTEYH